MYELSLEDVTAAAKDVQRWRGSTQLMQGR